tara:strand:+ start:58503 stop:59042 length:540 start_codon:yes stop_codon:yes gene_type:complete
MHYISKIILFVILRWKIKGEFPKRIKQYVLIAAPHTSWLDFPLGLLIRSITRTNIHFVGKKVLFKYPQGFFFRLWGGFSIDRSISNNTVDVLIDKFKENENFILAISPEGTRQKTDMWKTGYYYIAKGANIPIVKVVLDYQNKTVIIATPFYPTDNVEKDIDSIQNYYKGKQGKHPLLS